MRAGPWKRWRYRLEWLACALVARVVPALPRRLCVGLARWLGRVHWALDSRGRAVARANLRAAFGDALPPARRDAVARASFENFARALLDLFWARRLTAQTYARWMRFENFDQVEATRREHGANIFVVLHLGSYEWLSLGVGFRGMPVWIVAQDFKNPRLEGLFRRGRQVSGHRLIGQAQSMLRMLRAVRRGDGGAGLLVDLTLRPSEASTTIETFGGLQMCVTFLHVLLHQRTSVPLTPLTNVPQPDGTCVLTAHPPLVFPPDAPRALVAQACWDALEPLIRAHPEHYLWNYKHFRYLPAGLDPAGQARYPFYAQRSRAFDRLLAREGVGAGSGRVGVGGGSEPS